MAKSKSKKPKPKSRDNKHKGFRIIITSQNKVLVSVYSTPSKVDAVESFEALLRYNSEVIRFPKKFSSRDHKLVEAKYEILLIESIPPDEKGEVDSNVNYLRNEFGKLTPVKTNTSKGRIYRKEIYFFEEDFWVYGFNNKSDRKDFNFILNELVLLNLEDVKYPTKTIYIYKNKLLIEDDNDLEIVICKNMSDSFRLYMELEEEIKKMKIKTVFFMGEVKDISARIAEEKMMQKTNWKLTKIRRNSTRP